MGLVGERKALAAAVLSFYMLFYVLFAIAPPPGLEPLQLYAAAMGALYGVSFFALVAGYFWARWFAVGLGIHGLIGGIFGAWQIGLHPVILFLGGTHALVSLVLWGNRVASHFDGRTEWRARFHLDDSATRRLGKAIIRVGISLPFLIGYGLTPRQGMDETLLSLAVVALVTAGAWGLLRLRTWGVIALAGAGVTVLASVAASDPVAWGNSEQAARWLGGGLGGALLVLTATPFAGPIARYLRG